MKNCLYFKMVVYDIPTYIGYGFPNTLSNIRGVTQLGNIECIVRFSHIFGILKESFYRKL